MWKFYHEQTKDSVLAYALSIKEVQDGKVIGNIYTLDYGAHVERVKLLTCPIGKVAVLFEDGANITIPYQNQRQLMNELMPVHGSPKTMTELPENERELAVILKRERLKRSHHTTNGDIKEYINSLKKGTLRGKLKESRTAAVSAHKPPFPKKEPER